MKTPRFLRNILLFIVGTTWLFSSCTKGYNPDASSNIPNVTVNLSANINSAGYTGLKTVGGQAYATGGYRGIVLYRLNASTIMAFDRTCSYDLSDANGIVQAQTNGTAICLECSSEYNLANGNVVVGPSTIGLKAYNCTFYPSTGAFIVNN